MSADRIAARTSSRRASVPPWIYLTYLANMVWQPLFDESADVADWAVVAVVVVLFLPLWVAVQTPDHRRRRRVVLAMVVLGVLATTLNVGASVVLVFAAWAVARFGDEESLRWLVAMTLALVLLMVVSPIPLPYRVWGVLPSLMFVWIVGLGARNDVAVAAEAERLRVDNVRVEALATAAERDRIAGDLHDVLGQSLTGLVVRSQLVRRLTELDPAAAADEATGLEEGARAALEQLRAVVAGLNDVSLDDEVVEARRVLAAAGVAATVELPGEVRPGALVERSLALALREAVTNVVRHAEASTCTIELARTGTIWTLEVRDDGRGGEHTEGAGLRGMRERVIAVGGTVERWSDRGTGLRVTVPA